MTEQEFADKLEQYKVTLELNPEEGSAMLDEILAEMGLPEVI